MEADYNEIVGLDLELNNVGNQLAQNISITISSIFKFNITIC